MKRPFGFMNQLEKRCVKSRAQRLMNKYDKSALIFRRANIVWWQSKSLARQLRNKASRFVLDATEIKFLERVKATKL